MFDVKNIRAFVRDNHEELTAIMESQRMEISNSPLIKLLHGKYLVPFWKERPNKEYFYAIYFDEALIEDINLDAIANSLDLITESLKIYNWIKVNSNFEVIEQATINLNEEALINQSNTKKVVFFFGLEGIDTAIRGKIIDKINVFYNEVDRMEFAKRYHISQIDKCLKDYEAYIGEPGINQGFFASDALVNRLRPVNTPRNILLNKPEKILRDNLISFLNRHTQHTFSKENELNNQRELDLYTEVKGKKYLVEVKWLGQSINDMDTDLTQKVTDVAAREGVTQTLDYIKQLIEDMNFNLHCGYLCVFDVREVKNPINYRNFDFITNELQVYYKNHFIKLDEINLDRV
ncbi:hypothetical protein ASG38_12240 [Flavobacterium sp. Leaf359]|uniref:hypothetical protein n=1 Tax=Flavobacterium sp. Leaf359 TaxID=1736351 RepID=UPI0006F5EDB2|nr:hypothetical protein [Flavobacterium sp. Leaf359]KQS46557.1 hypothetical protein ASG38_12240 [Flavobacterium sp. Leaf359]